MSEINVRRLGVTELPLALPLLMPEGWSLDPPDLARIHALGGAVGAFANERLVGFLTFLDTPPYRWIGNVAVDASQRGAGIGARLLAETTRDADRVALYSVEKAVSLYARAGLAPHGHVHSLRALEPRPLGGSADKPDLAGSIALDQTLSGMDRSRLLRALFDAFPAVSIKREGRVVAFGVAKTYHDITEIGPVVAEKAEDAWAVVDELLYSTPPPYDVAVHSIDPGWAARGFAATFRAIPMFRGGPPAWDLPRYHAAAGLEKG